MRHHVQEKRITIATAVCVCVYQTLNVLG